MSGDFSHMPKLLCHCAEGTKLSGVVTTDCKVIGSLKFLAKNN